MKKEKVRLLAILFVAIAVILTGALFSYQSFAQGEIMGGVLAAIIALIIIVFALFVYKRGNQDIKNGFPIKDERSRRVMEKASSTAFYISLYLLLAVGFLSEEMIPFRDVSQATSISVGCMALLFAGCWAYYNRQEI